MRFHDRFSRGSFGPGSDPRYILARCAEIVEACVDAIDTGDLPPLVAKLIAPWLDAIKVSEPGMGDHVMAIAAHCFDTLRRRIEPTPALEEAFADTMAATDTLATALDIRRAVPPWVHKGARKAMINLIEALREAEPSAVTKELGLGW